MDELQSLYEVFNQLLNVGDLAMLGYLQMDTFFKKYIC